MIVDGPAPIPPESSPGARAFGHTIRGRRIGAGMTLRACAERMGVSMTVLSMYEQGVLDMPEHRRDDFEKALAQRASERETRA